MAICLLGLGSNLGDRTGNIQKALHLLRRQVEVLRFSSLHETLPVGGPSGQANYLNGAAVIATDRQPIELLAVLQDIESQLGRERAEFNGPRTVDLDLLLYDQQVIHTPKLTVPHARMHERRFVLAPAAEIAGDLRHPALQAAIDELLTRLPPPAPGEPKLRIFTSAAGMQRETLRLRRLSRRVGLVPTMGALHEGHLSLVQVARERAEVVIATIFVNPTQFGPSEDFSKYPRALEADLQALSAAGCDHVFVPSQEEMYAEGSSTFVEPPAVSQPLEGVCRPGHFRGVATIVLKLFEIIPADLACFGQKDYQQAQVIRRMVADLNVPIEIVVCPIIREPDGLAMSSRNRYLSPAERQQALALSQALGEAERLFAAGETESETIVAAMRNILRRAGITRIDYVTLADPETLAEVPRIEGRAVALIACFVGTTRLIDNRLFGKGMWRA
jgi:pantoate--beta-alanine ligase/2-amino-4-hydroxy-6-hydroxymethyldihydropteridine pyrophosphokinase